MRARNEIAQLSSLLVSYSLSTTEVVRYLFDTQHHMLDLKRLNF